MQAQRLPIAIAAALLTIFVSMAYAAQADQVRLSWDAPTLNEDETTLTDLAGYILYYGQTSGNYAFSVDVGNQTNYTLSGLTEGQRYYFSVTAYDTSDNESDFAFEVDAVPSAEPSVPTGLVAAYSFDAGSGPTVADISGNSHTGTISGATWTPQGKFGSALAFDGVNAFVSVPDAASLDLGTQGTIEAWVKLTTLGRWHSVLAKGSANNDAVHNYALEITDTNVIRCLLGTGTTSLPLDASLTPVAGQFYHLSCTWDGTTVRLYVNGTLNRSTVQTLTPAGNTAPLFIGQFGGNADRFAGTIDEVRLYNRFLTASEIQTDMTTPVLPSPGGAPVAAFSGAPTAGQAPLTVTFSDASSGSITARSWTFGDGGTSTAQNPSRTYANPGTYSVGLTVSGPGGADTETKTGYITVNQVTPPPVAAFSGAPTAGQAPLTVTFSDASSGSITARSWTFGDGGTSTAQNPSRTYANPGTYSVGLTVSGPGGADTETKTGYITVNQVTPPPVAAFSGAPTAGQAPLTVTFSDASSGRITAWSWTFGDGGTSTAQHPSRTYTSSGTYSVSLSVSGPDGADSEIKANYITVPSNVTGLVAAYNFDAGSGSTLTDMSGNGRHGTIAGATWTTQGKFGKALSFDGVNDMVTVHDAASLDLTTGMTLEAWVYPTANTGWRTVVLKERPGHLAYALYASSDTNQPLAQGVFTNGNNIKLRGPSQLSVNTWTHLAATYDGATLRLYVNGTQVRTQAIASSMLTSGNPLRIGGNSVWGEWFKGSIDDIRLYNRALTTSEIQADMNTAVK